MVRKILEKVPDEVLARDLEKYRQRAIELGATDAKIITTDKVIVDDRVRAKCTYPKCPAYGTNANCPPYAMDLPMVRKVVSGYRYAIFSKIEVPSEDIAGPEARKSRGFIPFQVKNYEIVSKIESEAFYDGYHLALGFTDGHCKGAFCPTTECRALLPGQSCRHALKARSSMEAVGMDAYRMAASVGWDIYPVGVNLPPSEVPHGTILSLVLVY